ncbi:NUDIX hydrolase [Nonomuraea sp. bgisy101]|uniref:NUDIX hydrolase n=1 Tax=Nonomuraea sp. bgisy101 TaxID=3413784 RepID=UPI003D702591
MPRLELRRSVRAILVDEDDHVLLCCHDLTSRGGPVVWAMPGGGVEPGESDLTALRRELDEEVGLALRDDPLHVWHQEVRGPDYADGHDGVINDYFLIRTPRFAPRGSWTDRQLAAENITRFRWWTVADIAAHGGEEVFSPRALADRLRSLLTDGLLAEPIPMGL